MFEVKYVKISSVQQKNGIVKITRGKIVECIIAKNDICDLKYRF